MKLNLTTIAAIGLLAVGGYVYLGQSGNNAVPAGLPLVNPANAQEAAEVDISTIDEMTIGAEDAPVTMIEYASYTCPHCANFHATAFKQIKKNYIDTGKVKFIYREVYFDRYGLWASMIARCDSSKFFGMNDLIYSGQDKWARAGGPAEIVGELRKIGRLAGLEEDTLEACLKDGDKARTLVAWYQHNAEADEVSSTPSFVVNGKKVANQTYDEFAKLLDEELGS